MSECLVSSSASHPAIAPRLCYSNFMGIKNSSVFKCIDCIQDNYVLIYVTRGQLYCEQERHSFVLIEGDYLLLDKSIMHSYYFKDEEPSEIYWIHINGKLAKKLIAEIDVISPLPFVGKNPKILADLEECFAAHREQRDNPFEHSARLLAMHLPLLRKQ